MERAFRHLFRRGDSGVVAFGVLGFQPRRSRVSAGLERANRFDLRAWGVRGFAVFERVFPRQKRNYGDALVFGGDFGFGNFLALLANPFFSDFRASNPRKQLDMRRFLRALGDTFGRTTVLAFATARFWLKQVRSFPFMKSDSSSNLDSATRAAALKQARQILQHHGKSYYFSSRLFPRRLQEATWVVYAFVRLPDEIVDNSPQETPDDLKRIEEKIHDFRENWRRAYEKGDSGDVLLELNAEIWRQYQIPYDYSEAFLSAMIQDTHQTDYRDYQDLENYMYGSAAVIGLMMSHLIGFKDEKTLEKASKLGYAMQLTNFLRDIDEDFQTRGRVYMPANELEQFGLGRKTIEKRDFSPKFEQFMRFQGARAHKLYAQANEGIAELEPEGRFAVAMASTLYNAILGKLEQQNWNPFAQRAATSFPHKIVLMGRARALSRRVNEL